MKMLLSLIVMLVMTAASFAVNTTPLCFTAEEDGVILGFERPLLSVSPYLDAKLQYSYDGVEWVDITGNLFEQTVSIGDKGAKLYLRAGGDENKNATFNDIGHRVKITLSGKAGASGNVMSLIDASCQQTSVPAYAFANLFYECKNLTSAPELPATTIAEGCYYEMFDYCTSLVQAPELPATTLASLCYYQMFDCCTSLEQAPELPAKKMEYCCYMRMFCACTSLKAAPALPSTELAIGCYQGMFLSCWNITSCPELPATTLTRNCYEQMFSYCRNITTAPALPATTLPSFCYTAMFENCPKLKTAPALPATTIAEYCYYEMFRECTSLTKAPALPATTMKPHCYEAMFCHCENLIASPLLPATTLADSCYIFMFEGCYKLKSIPDLPATVLPKRCYYYMFAYCTSLNVNSHEEGDEWSIPADATVGEEALTDMFRYSPSPTPGVTYYVEGGVVRPYKKYDVNGDGLIAMDDVSSIIDNLKGKKEYNSALDVNGDGKVTKADLNWETNKILGIGNIPITSIGLSAPDSRLAMNDDMTITATITPLDAEIKKLEWSSDNESVASVSKYGVVSGNSPGNAVITAKATDGSGMSAEYEVEVFKTDLYINLGLPSGTLWAACNLGADRSEDYGDYYAWGETKTKDSYTWLNYFDTDESQLDADGNLPYNASLKKYNVDGQYTTLEESDDAVIANLDDTWCMPTKEQLSELYNNCSRNSGEKNGVAGCYFTGPSGRSIFIPYAGYYNGTTLCEAGNGLYSWSKELGLYSPDGRCLVITSSSSGFGSYDRYRGLTIRPVKKLCSFSESSATIEIGDTYTQKASAVGDGAVTYSSSNTAIATVDATTGKVTGVGLGVATITATLAATEKYAGASATYTVTVMTTALIDRKFSVSATKKVQFTSGNLYWDGSAFKIEENQTDFPTVYNASHVGHFFWTNSTDYQGGKATYMPYTESYKYSNLQLYDKLWCGEKYPLSVGGVDGLYVLSCSSSGEWYYLLYKRTNASNLRKYGVTVTYGGKTFTNCCLLAPDDFDTTQWKADGATYTLDEVNALDLVCLPAAGYRKSGATDVSSQTGTGALGYYCSSTPYEYGKPYAYPFYFEQSKASITPVERSWAQAIRLVRTVEE